MAHLLAKIVYLSTEEYQNRRVFEIEKSETVLQVAPSGRHVEGGVTKARRERHHA